MKYAVQDPISTSLSLDFPPLMELSIQAASDVHAALGDDGDAFGTLGPSDMMIMAHARLLADLTLRTSQAVWLWWLALKIAPTVVPRVGCPGWRRVIVPGGNDVLYCLGSEAGLEFFVSFGPTRQIVQLECPALDKPNDADAWIRALVVACMAAWRRSS